VIQCLNDVTFLLEDVKTHKRFVTHIDKLKPLHRSAVMAAENTE
jgi:hypothetical protein